MPRQSKVKTTYTRAAVTPSLRKHMSFAPTAKTPRGMSPLTQYIEDNKDTGISVKELIAQFQEYDCEHQFTKLAHSNAKNVMACSICGLLETKFHP